jgi:predicted kinase
MDLVVFVGLQASGKSTFYRSRFASTHTLVSKDLLRNNRNRERRQRGLVVAALERGESVVVDNTNPTTADRAPLVEIARSFGARAVCYYFESRLEACQARNAVREGRACVPEAGLRATAKRLEVPSYDEGFDEIYYVRIASGEAGEFVVEPWRKDLP